MAIELDPRSRFQPYKVYDYLTPGHARRQAVDQTCIVEQAGYVLGQEPVRWQTGAIVWEMELPAGVSNSPMTYMVNGRQFIVVGASGRTFPGELVALALP